MSAGRPPGDRHPIATARSAAAIGLAVVAGSALAACGQGSANLVNPPAASSPAASTGSARGGTAVAGSAQPIAPLTGLPAASAADSARPAVALVVADASPQGLGSADVVFEEITTPLRFIAIYQSRTAASVGPITTTRPTDGQVLSVVHPLFGYVGGSGSAVRTLDKTKVIDLGGLRYPSLYVTTPGGLTASIQTMMTAAKDGPPPPLFSYRGTGANATDKLATTGMAQATSVQLVIPGAGAQIWNYDSRTGRWSQSGDSAAQAANLVIQTVPYKAAYIDKGEGITAPTAEVLGSGSAEVLSGDMAAIGTWGKRNLANVTNYFDKNGLPMELQAGPTWVILAPQGTQVKTAGGRS